MEPIKVFGDKADQIEEGDTFRAVVTDVDGHRVVLLVKEERRIDAQ